MNKLDNLTIGDIRTLHSDIPYATPMKNALPLMRKFRDKHNLSDRDALKAYHIELPKERTDD